MPIVVAQKDVAALNTADNDVLKQIWNVKSC
jgi:hypothetical protein